MQNNQLKTKTTDIQEMNNDLLQASPLQTNAHPANLHKITPIFKSRTTWRCFTSSDPSYISKYQPKLLSHISISKLRPQEIGMDGLRKLRKVLVSCKRISSLRFHEKELNSKQMTYLFYSTNHWKRFSFSGGLESFAETVSRFGRCKHLEFFPFVKQIQRIGLPIVQPINPKILTRIGLQVRKLRKVKTMTLSFPFHDIPNFKLPRSLKNLQLSFQDQDTLIPQQELPYIISSCNQLEHLALSFFYDYPIEASDVQIWDSFFQKTSISLKKLTLRLTLGMALRIVPNPQRRQPQQPEQIEYFISTLRHLKKITSLELFFWGSARLEPRDLFSSVSMRLQFMTQLEELRLTFSGFPFLPNNSFKELTPSFKHLKKLKKLQIDLPLLQSPDEALLSISESIKNLGRLNTLEIISPYTDFTENSMEIFSNNIAHHKLVSLSLTRAMYDYRDAIEPSRLLAVKSGIKKLASIWKNTTLLPYFLNLGKLVELSTLDIPLSTFDISNQDWNSLSATLGELKELSSLSLTIPKLDSNNNFEGFQSILSCLHDLPKLTSLTLVFNNHISDEEVGILASYLAGCLNLKDLVLRFKKGSQLGDQSLYFLRAGIRVLLSLENLLLEFWKTQSFGDEAVTELFRGLGVLKELDTFYFCSNMPSIQNNIPEPQNMKDYYNMRRLRAFYVNYSKFI